MTLDGVNDGELIISIDDIKIQAHDENYLLIYAGQCDGELHGGHGARVEET